MAHRVHEIPWVEREDCIWDRHVGDEVKVKGLYSHEISKWDSEGETKRKVKVSINSPLVTSVSEGFAPTHEELPF